MTFLCVGLGWGRGAGRPRRGVPPAFWREGPASARRSAEYLQTALVLFQATVLWLSAQAYDGYSACPKQYRSFRHHVQLPCNFNEQSWCTVPGSAYPW